jgi:glycosyltransferase involved in cell wall biosynthesis
VKILILDQFSEPGGAQFCLRDLMPEFMSRGWQATLMAPGDGALMDWSREAGIPTCTLPLGGYSNGRKRPLDFLRYSIEAPRMASAVRRIAQREPVDLLYVNGPRVLPGALAAGCPVLFHAHSRVRGHFEQTVVRGILRSTNASVIAASRYVADNHESAEVVYNGTVDLWGGFRTFTRRTARVGIIGRIAPEKGQLDFARMARRLTEQGAEAEFFAYGAPLFGHGAYAAQARSEAGSAVVFCGWTTDVGRTLRDLELLVVPSGPDEAATRVIMEAFSAGTPVVAYPSGGIPELVENGRTGLLTEKPDAESLAECIDTLLRNREMMERLSAEGRSQWEQRFRVERFRSRVCDLMERCARNSSETRRAGLAPERAHDETPASR